MAENLYDAMGKVIQQYARTVAAQNAQVFSRLDETRGPVDELKRQIETLEQTVSQLPNGKTYKAHIDKLKQQIPQEQPEGNITIIAADYENSTYIFLPADGDSASLKKFAEHLLAAVKQADKKAKDIPTEYGLLIKMKYDADAYDRAVEAIHDGAVRVVIDENAPEGFDLEKILGAEAKAPEQTPEKISPSKKITQWKKPKFAIEYGLRFLEQNGLTAEEFPNRTKLIHEYNETAFASAVHRHFTFPKYREMLKKAQSQAPATQRAERQSKSSDSAIAEAKPDTEVRKWNEQYTRQYVGRLLAKRNCDVEKLTQTNLRNWNEKGLAAAIEKFFGGYPEFRKLLKQDHAPIAEPQREERCYTVVELAQIFNKSEARILQYCDRKMWKPNDIFPLNSERRLINGRYKRVIPASEALKIREDYRRNKPANWQASLSDIVQALAAKTDIELRVEYGIPKDELKKLRKKLDADRFIQPREAATQHDPRKYLEQKLRQYETFEAMKRDKENWFDDFKAKCGIDGIHAQGYISGLESKLKANNNVRRATWTTADSRKAHDELERIMNRKYNGSWEEMQAHKDEWYDRFTEKHSISGSKAGNILSLFVRYRVNRK